MRLYVVKPPDGDPQVKTQTQLKLTSRLSEVSRSEIWGFFAGKSQISAVICPERSESAAWRGAERSEHRRVPEVAVKMTERFINSNSIVVIMKYENLDPRIPEIDVLSEGMSIAGYCKISVGKTDERLVFVVGKMRGYDGFRTRDFSAGASPILSYYSQNDENSRERLPEHIYLSQLEECIWLEESK